MSIERTYYCENPTCVVDKPGDGETPSHATTATPPPHLPFGFIETRDRDPAGENFHHFCSWDCLMKYAAQQPVAEIVELD